MSAKKGALRLTERIDILDFNPHAFSSPRSPEQIQLLKLTLIPRWVGRYVRVVFNQPIEVEENVDSIAAKGTLLPLIKGNGKVMAILRTAQIEQTRIGYEPVYKKVFEFEIDKIGCVECEKFSLKPVD